MRRTGRTTPVRIITRDKWCNALITAAVIGWIIALCWIAFAIAATRIFSADSLQLPSREAVVLVLSASLLASVMVAARTRLILRVIVSGEELEATVSKKYLRNGFARIDYKYQFGGTAYENTNVVLAENWLRDITIGDTIAVLADPAKPSRSYIRNAFAPHRYREEQR